MTDSSLSREDVDRIADAVVARLERRTGNESENVRGGVGADRIRDEGFADRVRDAPASDRVRDDVETGRRKRGLERLDAEAALDEEGRVGLQDSVVTDLRVEPGDTLAVTVLVDDE